GAVRDRYLGPAEQGLTRATKSLDNPAQAGANDRPSPAGEEQATAQPQQEKTDRTNPTSNPDSTSKTDRTNPTSKTDPASKTDRTNPTSKPDRTNPASSPRGAAEKSEAGAESPPEGSQPSQSAGDQGPRTEDQGPRALAEAKTNQKAIADELQKMLDGL